MKLEQKKQENFHKEENWKKYQHPVLTDYLSILLGTQANSSHINTSIVHEETDRGPKCRGIILISTTYVFSYIYEPCMSIVIVIAGKYQF